MKIVFDTYTYTDEYIDTILDLLQMAGFHIDLVNDIEGDVAILTGKNIAPELEEKQKNILTNLRKFDIL